MCVAAAPTDAYCDRSSSSALRDQGMISASNSNQSVSSSSHRPASATAFDTRSRTARSSAGSEKNRRPVRVTASPAASVGTKRRWATSELRHTITIARDPMCFSSQITDGIPSERKDANASAGCSSKVPTSVVAVGAMVGGR